MKKHEEIGYLASAGVIKTSVVFCCHKCKTEFSSRSQSVYLAARTAIAEGWCIKDLGDIFCPKCAVKQL